MDSIHLNPGTELAAEVSAAAGEAINKETPLAAFLRRPRVAFADVYPALARELEAILEETAGPEIQAQVEIETKYEGYIRRQEEEIARVRRHEGIRLPEGIDYGQVPGLSAELAEKLTEVGPATLAQASRIPGMTPAALSLLLVYAKKLSGTVEPADAAVTRPLAEPG